jgi:subtilisin family serine protease
VEPNVIDRLFLAPNDPEYAAQKQWGLDNVGQSPPGGTVDADIDAPQAWDHETGSSDIIVSVLDSGIPMVSGVLSHPDLDSRLKIIIGSDIQGDGESVTDHNGHGTHVAGIISAETNNGVGVAGVCWNCRLMINQVFDSQGSGSHENFRDGMIYSVDQGARLANYSGGGSSSSTKEHGVAYADSHGVLLVAAAGNNWGGSVSYPAAYAASYDNVICVSSTDPTDHVSPFSSIGSQVCVAAPGGSGSPYDSDDIYSTMPNYYVTLNGYGITQNYGYCAGTSMASPMVAGVAALILSVDPSLLPSEIREIIEVTAQQVGGYYYDPVSGKCNQLGHGRVNAQDAVLLTIQGMCVAGDANGDEVVDMADAIYLLNYLYKNGSAPEPLASGDANADCVIDLEDAIYLLNYLYQAGSPPENGCA